MEKKKKSRSPVSEGREAAETETASAWTGEKTTKTQSTPSSSAEDLVMIARDDAEHPSGDIVRGQEQGSEEIEGLDWDRDKLRKEIDCCLEQLHDGVPYDDDDEFWAFDEQQLTALNQLLGLCRIRAHEYEYRELDDSSLAAIYPPSNLEHEGYYEHYQRGFEWYFDPEYCKYADLQDYQRLVLRDNGEYRHWEFYRKTCNSLEGDQQFVQFWETLSKTKLIELYLKGSSSEEFTWSIRYEDTWYKYYAGFFFDMWALITKQKMNFKEALRQIHEEDKYSYCSFAWKTEFEKSEPNLDLMEQSYKPYLDRIGATAQDDDAYQSIMESVKEILRKHKTYYDYAKKKLRIAKEIVTGSCYQQFLRATPSRHLTSSESGRSSRDGLCLGHSPQPAQRLYLIVNG